MDATFMSSGNTKTSASQRLLFNISDKINLKRNYSSSSQELREMEEYKKVIQKQ